MKGGAKSSEKCSRKYYISNPRLRRNIEDYLNRTIRTCSDGLDMILGNFVLLFVDGEFYTTQSKTNEFVLTAIDMVKRLSHTILQQPNRLTVEEIIPDLKRIFQNMRFITSKSKKIVEQILNNINDFEKLYAISHIFNDEEFDKKFGLSLNTNLPAFIFKDNLVFPESNDITIDYGSNISKNGTRRISVGDNIKSLGRITHIFDTKYNYNPILVPIYIRVDNPKYRGYLIESFGLGRKTVPKTRKVVRSKFRRTNGTRSRR
jgi:hypothetical protein